MNLSGKKIVIAHPSADLYGSDRMMLETLGGLVSRGARVVVVVPTNGPLVPHIRAHGAASVVLKTLVLRKNLLSFRGAVSVLAQSLHAVRTISSFLSRFRPDIVYVSTVSIPWWPIVARLRGRRVLVHIHEAEGHVRPLIRHLMVAPLLFSSEVIVNSRYTGHVLGQSLPRRAAASRLVYNGVVGPISVTPPRQRLDGPVRLVYVGRISHRKGVDVAIDAVAELRRRGREVQLDVIGAVFAGNEEYALALRNLISQHGLQDYIHLCGFRESIWSSVDGADIVLVPARLNESFGNTVIESVLAARPSIVSAMPGLLEAGSGYASVRFVEPEDDGELASAVEEVIDDWSTWRRGAEQDRARAQVQYAPGRYQEEIVAAIAGTGLP